MTGRWDGFPVSWQSGKEIPWEVLADLALGVLGGTSAGQSGFTSTATRARFGRVCLRSSVRHILYMATPTATRDNPALATFYPRLRTTGHPPKVALVAALRKLLTILNAILRDRRPWQPT